MIDVGESYSKETDQGLFDLEFCRSESARYHTGAVQADGQAEGTDPERLVQKPELSDWSAVPALAGKANQAPHRNQGGHGDRRESQEATGSCRREDNSPSGRSSAAVS